MKRVADVDGSGKVRKSTDGKGTEGNGKGTFDDGKGTGCNGNGTDVKGADGKNTGGKDKDGKKHQGSWADGGNTDTEGAKGKGKQKRTDEYPGKKIEDIPEADRCCAHYLWVKKDGTSLCSKFNAGKQCHAPHTLKPSKAMLETKVVAKLKHKFGPPNCPASGPRKPEPEK